jgi:Flp pilus assembly protein TadB
VGYSVASGELKLIGETVRTDGMNETSVIQIGGQELRDISYNDLIAGHLKSGERVALLLSPTRYIIALRSREAGVVYSSEQNRQLMESKVSITYYVLMGLFGLLTALAIIGVIILFVMYLRYLRQHDKEKALAKFNSVSL